MEEAGDLQREVGTSSNNLDGWWKGKKKSSYGRIFFSPPFWGQKKVYLLPARLQKLWWNYVYRLECDILTSAFLSYL